MLSLVGHETCIRNKDVVLWDIWSYYFKLCPWEIKWHHFCCKGYVRTNETWWSPKAWKKGYRRRLWPISRAIAKRRWRNQLEFRKNSHNGVNMKTGSDAETEWSTVQTDTLIHRYIQIMTKHYFQKQKLCIQCNNS